MTTRVTGPCRFLVMYNTPANLNPASFVTGPCKFLVIYNGFDIMK